MVRTIQRCFVRGLAAWILLVLHASHLQPTNKQSSSFGVQAFLLPTIHTYHHYHNYHHQRQRLTRAQDNGDVDNFDFYDAFDDIDDDIDDDDVDTMTTSGFYDIDYEDDELELDFESDPNTVGFERDDADMLEEREDRLYVDEFGIRRKIETCILVGVEHLSKKRKQERLERSMEDPSNYDFFAPEAGAAPKVAVDQQEQQNVYFTLEESLTEMRELVKTAGVSRVLLLRRDLVSLSLSPHLTPACSMFHVFYRRWKLWVKLHSA